uniref:CSON006559 protein n=1 Tax=Culicoides sonorensis TaxID=179676 RepID=A0A336MVG6_CULSO
MKIYVFSLICYYFISVSICENVKEDISIDIQSNLSSSNGAYPNLQSYVTQIALKSDLNKILQGNEILSSKISNMEGCLGQKIEKAIEKISSLIKNEQICPRNMLCIERKQRKSGRFIGCYEDHRLQRIFKGYTTRLNFNTKENCIDTCLEKRFTYAGTQAGDWCHCGNSAPKPSINKRLPDDQCFRECPGNFKQHCGGPLSMNIYETGIEEYRFDPDGNPIDEPDSSSAQEFVLKFDCDRKYI